MDSLPRNHDNSGNWRTQEHASPGFIQESEIPQRTSASLSTFFPSTANSSPCSFMSAKEDVDELELVQYDFSIPRYVTSSWAGSRSGPVSGSGSGHGSSSDAKPPQRTETSLLSSSCSLPSTSGSGLCLPRPCSQAEVSNLGSKLACSHTMGCESTDHDHLRYEPHLHHQHRHDIIPSSSYVSPSAIVDQQGHGTKTKTAPINNDIIIDIDAKDSQMNIDSRTTSVPSTVSPQRPQSSACDCADIASCCSSTLSFVPALSLSSKSTGVTHLPSAISVPSSSLPQRRYRTTSSTVASLDLPSALHQVSGILENTSSNRSGRWIIDGHCNESNAHLSGGSTSREPRRVRIQSAGHLLPSTLTSSMSHRPSVSPPLSPRETVLQIHPGSESPLLSCQHSRHSRLFLPINRPSNVVGFISSDINDVAKTPTTPKSTGSGSGSGSGSSPETSPFLTPMPSTSIKWASPKKRFGKSSTSMMSQALEAESNQYRQQQLGHLSNSRMLSVGLGGSNKARHGFYRRRGKLEFDKLPREIRVHVFRYLTTFQLIRVSRVKPSPLICQ